MPPPLLPPPRCEYCGASSADVKMRSSRTEYTRPLYAHELREQEELALAEEAAWRLGSGEAPRRDFVICVPDDVANRDLSLCDPCGEEHDAFWDERWLEYNYGRL